MMGNRQRLIEYLNSLCDILNKNGLKQTFYNKEYDWKINENDPKISFLGGIYSTKYAFEFLKQNGYLDRGICPFCGEFPIDNTYTFKSGLTPDREFSICKDCSNEGKKTSMYYNKKSGCYIATACYGDYDAQEVKVLRRFRDEVLYNRMIGRIFIRAYYLLSPPFARWLSNKSHLNNFIRAKFLDKIVNKLK